MSRHVLSRTQLLRQNQPLSHCLSGLRSRSRAPQYTLLVSWTARCSSQRDYGQAPGPKSVNIDILMEAMDSMSVIHKRAEDYAMERSKGEKRDSHGTSKQSLGMKSSELSEKEKERQERAQIKKEKKEKQKQNIEAILEEESKMPRPSESEIDLAYASMFPGEFEQNARYLPSLNSEDVRLLLGEPEKAAPKTLPSGSTVPATNADPTSSQVTDLAFVLPLSINERLEEVGGGISQYQKDGAVDWDAIIQTLQGTNVKLQDIPPEDVESFLRDIPHAYRADHAIDLMKLLEESKIELNTYMYNMFLQAFASEKREKQALSLVQYMQMSNVELDHWVYYNLLSLYFNLDDYKKMSTTVDQMLENNIDMNVNHYFLLLRMCFKTERFREMNQMFDLMKFRSLKTLPDSRIYSLMISACGVTRDAERALDLYEEMTTRPIEPLETNPHVLRSVIYACTKRADYRQKGWELALEYQERGFPISEIMSSMLQMCALSGDFVHARVFFLRMCSEQSMKPGKQEYGFLIQSYANAIAVRSSRKKGKETAYSLQGELGDKVRRTFLSNITFDTHTLSADVPPFLPTLLLTFNQIVSEVPAIMLFLQQHPRLMSRRTVSAYLQLAINSNLPFRFRRWFAETTAPPIDPSVSGVPDAAYCGPADPDRTDPGDSAPDIKYQLSKAVDPRFTTKVTRNRFIYDAALSGAYKFIDKKRPNLEFVKALYAERELWKTTPDYQKLTDSQRERFDLRAARFLLQSYAVTGHYKSGLVLLRDTVDSLDWTMRDMKVFYDRAHQTDNRAICQAIRYIAERVSERKAKRQSPNDLAPLL
ncbi:hypothetical protein BZA70DRAFT_294545 [Myxozyma melibiosi]|uniref:Mitochondrial 15S rRNA processing factor CCM1 n=1 Tax=Myxozyma melibiosi TaxID=54550 RepID=A0ABR1F8T9_9ASCO